MDRIAEKFKEKAKKQGTRIAVSFYCLRLWIPCVMSSVIETSGRAQLQLFVRRRIPRLRPPSADCARNDRGSEYSARNDKGGKCSAPKKVDLDGTGYWLGRFFVSLRMTEGGVSLLCSRGWFGRVRGRFGGFTILVKFGQVVDHACVGD
jgi:hypothetical protein